MSGRVSPSAKRREQLRARAREIALRLRVKRARIRTQRLTTKWGSCSARGIVTLSLDLLREPQEFQDYVIAHELLHLRIRNHSRLFKAYLLAHGFDWRRFEERAHSRVGGNKQRRANSR